MKIKPEHYLLGATALFIAYKMNDKNTAAVGALEKKELEYLQNYHVLKVTYLGPTNNSGSRVKITSDRFKESKTISYDYYYNSTIDMAQAYLESKGFNLIGKAEGKDCYYLISTTFEGLK